MYLSDYMRIPEFTFHNNTKRTDKYKDMIWEGPKAGKMSESILKEYYTTATGWEKNKILIEGRKTG